MFRYSSATPIIMHTATDDGELGSYLIPKGTQVRDLQLKIVLGKITN